MAVVAWVKRNKQDDYSNQPLSRFFGEEEGGEKPSLLPPHPNHRVEKKGKGDQTRTSSATMMCPMILPSRGRGKRGRKKKEGGKLGGLSFSVLMWASQRHAKESQRMKPFITCCRSKGGEGGGGGENRSLSTQTSLPKASGKKQKKKGGRSQKTQAGS